MSEQSFIHYALLGIIIVGGGAVVYMFWDGILRRWPREL